MKLPHRYWKGRLILTCDPKGAQVAVKIGERTYLGDVESAYEDFHSGVIRLRVRHFNNTPWPFDPRALAVDVLERSPESVQS